VRTNQLKALSISGAHAGVSHLQLASKVCRVGPDAHVAKVRRLKDEPTARLNQSPLQRLWFDAAHVITVAQLDRLAHERKIGGKLCCAASTGRPTEGLAILLGHQMNLVQVCRHHFKRQSIVLTL